MRTSAPWVRYVPAGSAGAGQIARITYASGRQLVHQYDATGQLTGLQWNGQPLVSAITWSPLGQATGWQWPGFVQTPGNPAPLAEQRSYTSAGQLAASALLQLSWDSAGHIVQIISAPVQYRVAYEGKFDYPGRSTQAELNACVNSDLFRKK